MLKYTLYIYIFNEFFWVMSHVSVFDFDLPFDILNQLSNSFVSFQVKGLDVNALCISHIKVFQAQKQRRRTYRAHEESTVCCDFLILVLGDCYYLIHASIVGDFFCSLYVISHPYRADIFCCNNFSSFFLLHRMLIYCYSCSLKSSWQQVRRDLKLFDVVLRPKLLLKLVVEALHS